MTTTPLSFWSELVKPDDGSETDAWGPHCIGIWDAWDRALGGKVSVDVSSADVTLSTSQAQHRHIEITGSPAAARNLVFLARNRTYVVNNTTAQNLFCYVTGASANSVFVPPGTMLAFVIEAVGTTRMIAPPMVRGGFPSTLQFAGKSYSGPGLFFGADSDMGLARRNAGQMGVCLADSEGRDSLRFNAGASASTPTIAMGSSFNDGLYPDTVTNGIAWTNGGQRRGALADGLVVGSASGGDKGAGTINSAGDYYRNNVALPFQRQFYRVGLSVAARSGGSFAHGLPGAGYTFSYCKCETANNGYAAGDVVAIGPDLLTVGSNSTQLFYRIGPDGLAVYHKTTGNGFKLTDGQWTLELGCLF